MNSIGQRLREARLARGLTQQQLAKGLATKGFISQVERDRATPSLAKLRLLAERLALPLSGLTGEPQPQELTYLRKGAELAVKAKESERALALLDEARRLASTAEERADLLRLRGTALDDLGRLAEALDVHQQAAAIAPADDPDLSAAIYAEIATVLNEQEQFNAGIEAGLRAVNWLDRSKHADPALKARVLSNLGRSSYELGQFERAHQFYLAGLAAATDAESLYRMANAQMSLGVTARSTGRLDEAVEHCNRALDIWSRIRQERSANRVLNNIGDVYYAQGKKAEAQLIQQQCFERAEQLRDDLEIGIAGGALARYALEAGDAAEALRLATTSAAAARRDGSHLHEASAIGIQAAAAEKLGHRRLAERHFGQALSLLVEREAGAKLAQVCTLYAEALRGRGQHDRAFALMRLAAARDFAGLRRLIAARK